MFALRQVRSYSSGEKLLFNSREYPFRIKFRFNFKKRSFGEVRVVFVTVSCLPYGCRPDVSSVSRFVFCEETVNGIKR